MRAPNFGVAVIYLSRCSLQHHPAQVGHYTLQYIPVAHTYKCRTGVGICGWSLHTLSTRTKASAFKCNLPLFTFPRILLVLFSFFFFLSIAVNWMVPPLVPYRFVAIRRVLCVCIASWMIHMQRRSVKECIYRIRCIALWGMWEHRTDCGRATYPHPRASSSHPLCYFFSPFIHFLEKLQVKKKPK
jgi:hypothetical protein